MAHRDKQSFSTCASSSCKLYRTAHSSHDRSFRHQVAVLQPSHGTQGITVLFQCIEQRIAAMTAHSGTKLQCCSPVMAHKELLF